ncbi:MAG: hypothetical protein FVQ85_03020 [Planctomycetes bacterium]|nr:hypothetical protein [Planctomycetota bacterium]
MKRSKDDKLRLELRDVVSRYLDENVKIPSLDTVEDDIFGQARLISLLLMVKKLVQITWKHGTDFDEEYLSSLSKNDFEKRIKVLDEVINCDDYAQLEEQVNIEELKSILSNGSSRKFLLAYITREINWIGISILSASYISSLILMRSVFELIVVIASRETSKMKPRIWSITFLEESEKSEIYKLWRRLCAWGHPYGKWLKEVCPVYSAHKPLYHQALFEKCLREFEQIVDLFAVVALVKFEVDLDKYVLMVNELKIDITGLKLLEARLKD